MIDRRDFMATLAAACVAARVPPHASGPAVAAGSSPPGDLEAYLAFERSRLAAAERYFTSLRAASPTVVPEYDRTLGRVLLTQRTPDVAELFTAVVAHLPAAAQLLVVIPLDADGERWRRRLGELYRRDVTVVPARATEPIEIWAQDILETVWVRGRERFLLPLFYRYARDDLARDDPAQLRFHVDGVGAALDRLGIGRSQPLPFFFQGGDLSFDRTASGTLLLTTPDPILNTVRYYRQVAGREVGHDEVTEWMRAAFGASEVSVVTRLEARRYTLHLDQLLCLLAGRTALVTTIVDDPAPLRSSWQQPEIAHELARSRDVRQACVSLGYEIVEVETTRQQLAEGKTAVNGIPYRDPTSGRRRLLMPTWDGMSDFETAAQRRAVARIEACGVAVTLVADRFHVGGGGPHCAVNVLS